MHDTGVQFTGLPGRGDERQDQPVAHREGARERREGEACIGEVPSQPEAAPSLRIHIVHAEGHLLARMSAGIAWHSEVSSVVALMLGFVRCVAATTLCAYRQGGRRA